jgi:hypothetical protein
MEKEFKEIKWVIKRVKKMGNGIEKKKNIEKRLKKE